MVLNEVIEEQYMKSFGMTDEWDQDTFADKLTKKLSKYVHFRKASDNKKTYWNGLVLGLSKGNACLDISQREGAMGSYYDLNVFLRYSGVDADEIQELSSILERSGLTRKLEDDSNSND